MKPFHWGNVGCAVAYQGRHLVLSCLWLHQALRLFRPVPLGVLEQGWLKKASQGLYSAVICQRCDLRVLLSETAFGSFTRCDPAKVAPVPSSLTGIVKSKKRKKKKKKAVCVHLKEEHSPKQDAGLPASKPGMDLTFRVHMLLHQNVLVLIILTSMAGSLRTPACLSSQSGPSSAKVVPVAQDTSTAVLNSATSGEMFFSKSF